MRSLKLTFCVTRQTERARMLASSMKDRHDRYEAVRNFSTPLIFPETVKKLDNLYGFTPFSGDIGDCEMWDYIKNHPKIKSYGLDELHLISTK